jgi:hypothetical protein
MAKPHTVPAPKPIGSKPMFHQASAPNPEARKPRADTSGNLGKYLHKKKK